MQNVSVSTVAASLEKLQQTRLNGLNQERTNFSTALNQLVPSSNVQVNQFKTLALQAYDADSSQQPNALAQVAALGNQLNVPSEIVNYISSQTASKNLQQTINGLSDTILPLDPQSAQAIAIQSRISSLEDQSHSLEWNSTVDARFPGNSDAQQQFRDLTKQLPFLELGSPQYLKTRSQLLKLGKSLNIPRKTLKDLAVNCMHMNLANVTGQLYVTAANLQLDSQTAIDIQKRIDTIKQLDASIAQLAPTNAYKVVASQSDEIDPTFLLHNASSAI